MYHRFQWQCVIPSNFLIIEWRAGLWDLRMQQQNDKCFGRPRFMSLADCCHSCSLGASPVAVTWQQTAANTVQVYLELHVPHPSYQCSMPQDLQQLTACMRCTDLSIEVLYT